MRKVLQLIVITTCLLTGCTKKLICEKTDKESMIMTKETFLVNYKNDQVGSIQIDLVATLNKKYQDYSETVEKNLKEQFQKYEELKGISLTSSSNDNIVRIQLFIETDKMKEKDKKSLKLINLKDNYDQVKKTLEQKKYQCN